MASKDASRPGPELGRVSISRAAQAATVWIAIEALTSGMTGANGELLGGLWTLLVSVAAHRASALPRAVVAIGVLAGAAGVASTVPGLASLVGVFALAQLVWFVGLGVVLRRPMSDPRHSSPAGLDR